MGDIIKILLAALLTVSAAYAQEVEGQKPTLNDHTFVPVSFMNSPFINSRLTMPLGVGTTTNFDFPIENDLDTLIGLKGEVLFANLGIKYSQKLRDWISFYISLGLVARIGTNFESIIAQGFNTVVNFETGSMIKLYESNKTLLSLSVEVQNYNANFVDIQGFVKDVVDSVPNPEIVRAVPALTAGGGLHFAWGINDLVGVRAESVLSYGETFTRGASSARYSIKGGVDLDFNKRYQVPLGVAFTYTVTTEPEIVYVDDRTGEMFFWKIAYTGRKDFDLGIESGVMVLPLPDIEEKPKVSMVVFTMSYFFN